MASELKYIWEKIFWKFEIFSEFLTSNSNLKLKHYNTIPPSFCQTQFWDKWPGVSLYNLSVEGVNLTIFYWHNINFNTRQVHYFPLWLLPAPPGTVAHLVWARKQFPDLDRWNLDHILNYENVRADLGISWGLRLRGLRQGVDRGWTVQLPASHFEMDIIVISWRVTRPHKTKQLLQSRKIH